MTYNAYPSLVRLEHSSGVHLAAWSERGAHGTSLASIKVRRRIAGVWGAPITVISTAATDYECGILAELLDGSVLIAGSHRPVPGDAQNGVPWVMRSPDVGQTWGDYVEPTTTLDDRCTIQGPPVVFESGRWLLPAWGRATDGPWSSVALITDDEGTNWDEVVVRADGAASETIGFNEWGCAVRPDNSALAILRHESQQQLYAAQTDDEGDTWHSHRVLSPKMLGAPRPVHYTGDWVISLQRDMADVAVSKRGCIFATDGTHWARSAVVTDDGFFVYGQLAPDGAGGWDAVYAHETGAGASVKVAPVIAG